MSDPQSPHAREEIPVVSLDEWISKKRSDPVAYLERQATEILITAISSSPFERKIYLKGGVLMGILYNSPRQTGDIDFSTILSPKELNKERLINQLNANLDYASKVTLGYPDIIMLVQSVKEAPRPSMFETASFPALKFKIGYARRGTPQAEQVSLGRGANVLEVDISFNEPIEEYQIVKSSESQSEFYVYSLNELISEKIRAFLQQEIRNRMRRQDIYDLSILIKKFPLDREEKAVLYSILVSKCESRGIVPKKDSIDDPELIRRAKAEWSTLEQDLGEPPPAFEECHAVVSEFYKSLFA